MSPAAATSSLRVSAVAVAALVAVLTVAAADTALRLACALRPTPNSYDVPRNPDFRRGWRDFTRPGERAPGQRLVIVISNSQGFLRESPDGELTYPARLEALLNEKNQHAEGDVIVANWSVPGAQAPEMIVLAARAAEHRPDLVVLVAGAGNFSPAWIHHPLSFWLSDATLLAYLPAVRSRLPPAFLERTDAYDPLGWFDAWTGMGCARRRFVEKRDESWTWREEPPGQNPEHGPFLDARGESFTLGARGDEHGLTSEAAPIDAARAGSTVLLLREFVSSLRGTSPDTRLLVVGMPFARPDRPGALWRTARTFAPLARAVLSDVPELEVVDALEAVPSEMFVHETHLQPDGHARFARWLLPRVRRALGGGESAS